MCSYELYAVVNLFQHHPLPTLPDGSPSPIKGEGVRLI